MGFKLHAVLPIRLALQGGRRNRSSRGPCGEVKQTIFDLLPKFGNDDSTEHRNTTGKPKRDSATLTRRLITIRLCGYQLLGGYKTVGCLALSLASSWRPQYSPYQSTSRCSLPKGYHSFVLQRLRWQHCVNHGQALPATSAASSEVIYNSI